MKKQKSEYNACPVCGKPRGKGPDEFAHGKCMELRAKTEGLELVEVEINQVIRKFTTDQCSKKIRNEVKKKYLSGKNLPKWMFD